MSERKLRIILAYDGTDFCGWQIQACGRTVQGEVERALEILHEHPLGVCAAGRTDSGVHARGQVISFRSDATVPDERFARALNSHLPRDVRALSCVVTTDEFHARYSARWREYKYYIEPAEVSDPFSRRFAWTLKTCPDLRTLNACARLLVGTHDFAAFSAAGDKSRSTVRSIRSATFHVENRFVVFRIVGNAFLWKMVRSVVGTIVACCREARPPDAFRRVLVSRDRRRAGTTAPAKGLVLTRVYYDEST